MEVVGSGLDLRVWFIMGVVGPSGMEVKVCLRSMRRDTRGFLPQAQLKTVFLSFPPRDSEQLSLGQRMVFAAKSLVIRIDRNLPIISPKARGKIL